MDLEAAKKLRNQTPPLPWTYHNGGAIPLYESVERLKKYNSPLQEFRAVGDRVKKLVRSDDTYRADFPYPNSVSALQVWSHSSETDIRFFVEATYNYGADTSQSAGELLAVEAHWYHSDVDDRQQIELSGRSTQPIAVEYVDLADIYQHKKAALVKLSEVESSLVELEKQFIAEKSILFTRQEEFEELDKTYPIEGAFTITSVPKGDAPRRIRQQWVGLEVPFRNIATNIDELYVTTADIIVSLLAQGKPNAAQWFATYAEENNLPLFYDLWSGWEFQHSEGHVTLADKTSSVKFYNPKFAALRKEAGLR